MLQSFLYWRVLNIVFFLIFLLDSQLLTGIPHCIESAEKADEPFLSFQAKFLFVMLFVLRNCFLASFVKVFFWKTVSYIEAIQLSFKSRQNSIELFSLVSLFHDFWLAYFGKVLFKETIGWTLMATA